MLNRTPQQDRTPAFLHAITDLLQKYQITISPTEAGNNDVFILSIGDLDIHLIASPRSYLSIACKTGHLPDGAGSEALLSLLEANLFTLEHPVLSVGVSSKTREVLLSTRQPLSELNSAETFRLVESVIEQAQKLGQWLKAQTINNPEPSTTQQGL